MKTAGFLWDQTLPGITQMQRDQWLYSNFEPEQHSPLLRCYRWSAPTLSVGRFQQVSAELEARLQQLQIAWVRRPTGGQAILHMGDYTFSWVGPPDGLSIADSHQRFSQAIQSALQHLGLQVDAGTQSASRASQAFHCFEHSTPADLQIGRHKLLGSAQARRRKAVLQQSVIYQQAPVQTLQALFEHLPAMSDLCQHLPAGPQHLQAGVSPAAFGQALQAGFSAVFGLQFHAVPSFDDYVQAGFRCADPGRPDN